MPDVCTHPLLPATEPDRLRQRVSDAATLAGRMAHDFDNLLMGILGFTELAKAQTEPGSDLNKFLSELYQVAQRGLVVTQQMHDFSRGGRFSPVPTRLADVWQTEVISAKERAGARAEILADVDDNLPPVAMALEPLGLVVRHVLANAVEALPSGTGRVSAEARVVELTEPTGDFLPGELAPGRYVELTITDSGPGIRPDVLAQLAVAPFVTTKVRHRGLGVAIVYRVLDAHGGGARFEPARPGGDACDSPAAGRPRRAGRAIPTAGGGACRLPMTGGTVQ